ncbi:MAG: sugar ABC transporter substrate-binding protein [Chloroflexi bacterium]|nr:sugar ABC transporter substrate-binding protein [Chloroflexota bacterium]
MAESALKPASRVTHRLVILGTVVAIVIAACGGTTATTPPDESAPPGPTSGPPSEAPSGPVTLRWMNWATTDENIRPWVEDVVAHFEEQNPDIKIESEPVPVSEHLNQLVTRCSAGDCPDIAQVQQNDIFVLQAAGLIAPLQGYDDEFVDSLPDGTVNLASVDGTLYGVTWITAPIGFWYNKELMADAGLDPNTPPTTIDEMMSMIRTVRDQNPDIIGLGIDTTLRDIGVDATWPFMHAFGAQPIKDGKANANTPEMQAFLQWIRDLVANGDTLPGKKFGDFRQSAAQNLQLFFEDGPYMKGLVQGLDSTLTDELFYERWGVTAIPGGAGNGPSAGSSDHQIAIFESSTAKEAAFRFAKYLASDVYAIKTYTAPYGLLPPLAGFEGEVPQLANPASQAFIEMGDVVLVPPYGPQYATSTLPIMANIQRTYSTQDAIETIAIDMHAALERVYGK